MRAAQYVRMSTDHQQYSIENQKSAIADYAQQNGFEIIETYSDPAKSGLDIKRRPGLQALIDDVIGGRADFQAVLVFDVSRWGRFQDSDEAACYEFLCRRAGIHVHYCGEPFANDGSLTSSFLKMVKRTMAAEYLRELSVKVRNGQCRLAANGFKCGGRAGYGLRRLLLDSNGQPKSVLRDGERKSLATERVIYVPGPDEEVRVVRLIFSMFLEQDLPATRIARLLREEGVRQGIFGPWNANAIFRILRHPKYVGSVVFNRTSETLRSKRVYNPREQWVLRPRSFDAIVSQDVFDRAQAKLENLVNRRSNERLLAELRALANKFGKLTPTLLTHANGVASVSTYKARFGSLMQAYELIGYGAARYTVSALEGRRNVASLKARAIADILQALADAHIRLSPVGPMFRVRGHGLFDVEIARSFRTPSGHLRWSVRTLKDRRKHSLVAIRLEPGNTSVQDFVLIRKPPKVLRYFTLKESTANEIGIICRTVSGLVDAMASTRQLI